MNDVSSRVAVFFVVATMLLAPGAVADTYHNAPDASAHGGITGKIVPAAGLQTVVVVEPFEMKAYQAQVDAAGRFDLGGLPPGEYDLLIKTTGHVYEGITLETDPDAPAPSPAELKKALDEVKPMFFESEDYFHIKKIVRFTAAEGRGRMFVMQTRTKPTVDPAGNAIHASIRRFDLVDLVKTHKTWQIAASRHLLRQEVPTGSPDEKVELTYSPRLGGILVGEQVKDVGTLDLKKLPPGPAGKYGGADK